MRIPNPFSYLDTTDGHIAVSLIVLFTGIAMVWSGNDYGKEIVSLAGGWLGRSMLNNKTANHVKE